MKRISALVFSLMFLFLTTNFTDAVPVKKDKATVKVTDGVLAISTSFSSYMYSLKEGWSVFMDAIVVEDKLAGVMMMKLDKDDKPFDIVMLSGTNLNGEPKIIPFPKSNPQNAGLYKHYEKIVEDFVKKHKVKEIIQKYKVTYI